MTVKIKWSLLLFIIAAAMACKKNEVEPLPVRTIENTAQLKIVHASAYNINYTVQLKVNDVRVSNNITYSTPFPGGGLNTGGSNQPWYLAVNPGAVKISMSLPKAGTSNDSVSLYSSTINLEANKSYSAYIFDTAATTQTLLVTENTSAQALGMSRFKFVNLLPNLPALDLYVGTNLVAGNVAYKGISPEFTLRTSDTVRFYVRLAGAAPNSTPVNIYPTLSPFVAPFTVPNGRIMSVFTRGYNGVTGTRAPAISLLYN